MTAQPKFNWGISTLGCHELDLEETCALASRHGFQALEIRGLGNRLDLPEYLDQVYGDSGEVQHILNLHGLQVVGLNSGFSLIGSTETDRAELLGFVRWAEMLGVPYVRVFGGGGMDAPLTFEQLYEAASNLLWWESIRRENGWRTMIALETHCGFSSAERCLELQRHTGVPLHIIWDTHHTWHYGNETPQETWHAISGLVRHVHIKDSIPVPSGRHPYTYVLPGHGTFPAKEALALLGDSGYDGIVSLEWERKWHPYLPPLDEALEALVSNGWKQEELVLS